MTGTILTSVGSFFGGIQTYLIVGAVVAVTAAAGGAYAGYRWEHGEVLKLQLAQAQFATEAATKAADSVRKQDTIALGAAVTEAKSQAQIVTRTVTITKEIPAYVTPAQDAVVCIPVGLARVLRAAAAGADPASLQLAPGQSDDACSDVTASEVAGWFSDYAGTSQANAEQLNELELTIQSLHDSYAATPKVSP